MLYQVIKEELKCSFDVDNTLLMDTSSDKHGGPDDTVTLDYYGQPRIRYRHQRHIELLKSHKKRGYFITVRSHNGYAWAEEAVKALGLEAYVDRIETKDQFTVDDKDNCGIPVIFVEDI